MILDRHTSSDRSDKWDYNPQSRSLAQAFSQVSTDERAARYGQMPVTILLTGVPGAGKSTTAYALERFLFDQGRAAAVLDGQNLRLSLSRDLSFSHAERSENVRRAAEVARLMNNAGMISIVSVVAPEDEIRRRAAEVIDRDKFLLVYLTAAPEVISQRHPRRDDDFGNDFGADSVKYEPPADADLVLETDKLTTAECVARIYDLLLSRKAVF